MISNLAGETFKTGAAGAGLNEIAQKELSKIGDSGLHEIASLIIGKVGAKIVKGDSGIGAAIALDGTKYNYLEHEQYQKMLTELSNCKNEEEKEQVKQDWAKISDEQTKKWLETHEEELKKENSSYYLGLSVKGIPEYAIETMSVEAEIEQPKVLYEFKFFSLYGKDYGIRISDRDYAAEDARLKGAVQALGGGAFFVGSIYSGSGVGRNSVKVVGAAYKGRKYFTIALNKTDDIVKDIAKVVSKVETKVDDVIKGSSKAGSSIGRFTAQETSKLAATNAERVNCSQ